MDDFQHVGYSKSVIEFVAVAKEFCDFAESTAQMQQMDFVERLQKFLPLIYLKGTLLPECESNNEDLLEDAVSEQDYQNVQLEVQGLLGEYDEYLEVFDEGMQFCAEPILKTISEGVADIYQDLKNFLISYRCGVEEMMLEALWNLNANFESYWGKTSASLLRAVHAARYKIEEDDQENS